MRTTNRSIQLVVKYLDNLKDNDISKKIEIRNDFIKNFEEKFGEYFDLIHVGIDHLVYEVLPIFYDNDNELNYFSNYNSNKEILEKLVSFLNGKKFYFRLSVIEKKNEDFNTFKSYITKEKKFFKSNYKEKTQEIYFIGTYLESVKLEMTNERDSLYRNNKFICEIDNFSVDPEKGDYNYNLIWKKERYGLINEKMLPKELKAYEFIINNLEKRFLNKQSKKNTKNKNSD